MAQQFQHRRPGRLERLDLLELELLAPGDDRAPDQLVGQHDHCNHRGQSPDDRSHVACVGGCLQVRPKSGQPKIAVAQHEHLACHQEEPPPATDIIEFQISPMAEYGSSSWMSFCHQLRRYTSAASSSSRGMFLIEE